MRPLWNGGDHFLCFDGNAVPKEPSNRHEVIISMTVNEELFSLITSASMSKKWRLSPQRDKTNQSFIGSGWHCCHSIYRDSPACSSLLHQRNMATGFTKNAEENPEAYKAEVKGRPTFYSFEWPTDALGLVTYCWRFRGFSVFLGMQGMCPAGCKAHCCVTVRASFLWATPATNTGSMGWPSCTASPLKTVGLISLTWRAFRFSQNGNKGSPVALLKERKTKHG